MGYERNCRIAVVSFSDEDKEKLAHFLQKDNKKNAYLFCFKEYTKWYDYDKDLKFLSQHFPHHVFFCAFVGEDLDDNGYRVYHNGASMPGENGIKSFKLPLNETVKSLMNKVASVDFTLENLSESDYDGEENEKQIEADNQLSDALHNQLVDERDNLMIDFFKSMNLVEISDLFDILDNNDNDNDNDDDM